LGGLRLQCVTFIAKGSNLNDKKVAKAISLSDEKYCSASIMLGKTAQKNTLKKTNGKSPLC
jgi:uncharacterized OsmC-like protein